MVLMWCFFAFVMATGAMQAAKYASLSFHYYYGQNLLMEPMVMQDQLSFLSPEHEGKLVCVHGIAFPQPRQNDASRLSSAGIVVEQRAQGQPASRILVTRSAAGIRHPYIGRQQGQVLIAAEEELWRSQFQERHAALSLSKALLNCAFFLAAAWAAVMVALFCLGKAGGRALRLPVLSRGAALLTALVLLWYAREHTAAGVLMRNPIFDRPRGRTIHPFESGHFDPELLSTVQSGLLIAMLLLLLLPLLLLLWRKMRTKKS